MSTVSSTKKNTEGSETILVRNAEDINDVSAEAGVIATLIHHPDYYFHAEELKSYHFSNQQNSAIYQAIEMIINSGVDHIDAYNIVEFLSSTPGTRSSLSYITVEQVQEFIANSNDPECGLTRNSVEEYKVLVSNILNASLSRDIYRELKECLSWFTEDNGDKPKQDLPAKVYDALDSIMLSYSSSGTFSVTEFGEQVDKLWEQIQERQDGQYKGIPFKFQTLNDYAQIESGELIVVAAPAKGAKSMFMLNEAVDILRQGKSVMYLDSELSSRLFLCRMISHLTGIEFARVRSGRYTEEENQKIQEQIAWIKEQHFIHIYMPIFDKTAIYTSVKKADHMFGHLDVLIVDYLKPTGSSTEAYTVYSELGNLTDMIKNEICGNMGIAGLAAAQLTSNNKLADSAKIARNASTIMLMLDKSPEEIEADGEGSGRKKLIVAQNRNGMQHVDGEWINIDFNGNVCLLEEAKTKHYLEDPF